MNQRRFVDAHGHCFDAPFAGPRGNQVGAKLAMEEGEQRFVESGFGIVPSPYRYLQLCNARSEALGYFVVGEVAKNCLDGASGARRA